MAWLRNFVQIIVVLIQSSRNHFLFVGTFQNRHCFVDIVQPLQDLSIPIEVVSDEISAKLMQSTKPVVVRSLGRNLGWSAFELWNESYMIKEMPYVKVHRSTHSTTRLHSAAHPLHMSRNVEWLRPYFEINVSTPAFFDSSPLRNIKDKTTIYQSFFSPFKDLSWNIQKSVGETWPLSLGYRPVLEVNMWIGLPGLSTPFHYDGVHNAYVQVFGTKKFVLAPPSAWPEMHLFPKLHPSSRMSQRSELFEEHCELPINNEGKHLLNQVLEVTLAPGDVLYIPPFWFHHVSVVGNRPSMSVSVHSDSVDMDIRDGTTGRIGSGFSAPIWGGLTQSQRVSILAVYLGAIIQQLANFEEEGTEDGKQKWTTESFTRALLETRYDPLSKDMGVRGLDKALENAEINFFRTSFALPHMPQQMHRMVLMQAQAFIQWRSSQIRIPQSVWEIMLHDFIEDVAGNVLGALSVKAFLKVLSNEVVLSPERPHEGNIKLISPVSWDNSGENHEYPMRGSIVSIHYSVSLADEYLSVPPFETSRSSRSVGNNGEVFQNGIPFKFKVGGAAVIAGLERAVLHMKAGQRATVLVPSGLAYGSIGVGDGSTIPPYADLIFDIDLLSFN